MDITQVKHKPGRMTTAADARLLMIVAFNAAGLNFNPKKSGGVGAESKTTRSMRSQAESKDDDLRCWPREDAYRIANDGPVSVRLR